MMINKFNNAFLACIFIVVSFSAYAAYNQLNGTCIFEKRGIISFDNLHNSSTLNVVGIFEKQPQTISYGNLRNASTLNWLDNYKFEKMGSSADKNLSSASTIHEAKLCGGTGTITYASRHKVSMLSSIPIVSIVCGLGNFGSSKVGITLKAYLKSLALLNLCMVNIILIMDQNVHAIEGILSSWPQKYRDKLNITIVEPWYPEKEFKTMYLRRCTSQKLLLGCMFHDLDAVVYSDVDVIFLRPIAEVFQEFRRFNSQQFIGVSGRERYCRYGHNQCYNSGFLLMNLTRQRLYQHEWTEKVLRTQTHPEIIHIKGKDIFQDQNLLNLLKKENPELFCAISPEWDIRVNSRVFLETDLANITGFSKIHGTSKYFLSNKVPDFRLIFIIFDNWSMENDLEMLVNGLKAKTMELAATLSHNLSFPPLQYVQWMNYYPSETLNKTKLKP